MMNILVRIRGALGEFTIDSTGLPSANN